MVALIGEQKVVGVAQVGDGRKVGGRGAPPTPQDRGDMNRDAHALARTEPAGIALSPVGTRGAVVQEVRVNVDQHPR